MSGLNLTVADTFSSHYLDDCNIVLGNQVVPDET